MSLSTRTSCPQIYCVYSVTGVMMFSVKCQQSDFLVKIDVHFIYVKEYCDV